MNGVRFHAQPGAGTFLVHVVLIALLCGLYVPLMAVRMVACPLAEALIRATDTLHDTLAERLGR